MLPVHLSLLYLIFSMIIFVECEFTRFQGNETNVLSRRRRYLIFPDGSSLQLVYDQIIPIEDYTNLYILGVTVALAWELPDSPNLPGKTRTHNHSDRRKINVNQNHIKSEDHRRYYTYFDNRNYHGPRIDSDRRTFLINQIKKHRGIENNIHFRNLLADTKLDHFVYPALRMRRSLEMARNINGNKCGVFYMDSLHYLKRHRHTRFNLFHSIEKYLNGIGKNGAQCIFRAICETAQKASIERMDLSGPQRPDSFFKELLRVLFSLPSSLILDSNAVGENSFAYDTFHPKYDVALDLGNKIDEHQTDCTTQFPNCSCSIYSTDFWS